MSYRKRFAKNSNTLNYFLGSDLHPDFGLYDETKVYNSGDIVFYNGQQYEVKSGQTHSARSKGDLTDSPMNNTVIWKEYKNDLMVCYFYCSSSNVITINNTDTVVPLDSTGFNNGNYVLSGNVITINSDNLYQIAFGVSYQIESGGGSDRSDCQSWLELSTNGGTSYSKINGTNVYTYHRLALEGYDSASCTIVLNLNSGDKLRIVGKKINGNSTVRNIGDAVFLTIMQANGVKGSKGDKGDPGNFSWKGAWSSTVTYNFEDVVEYQGSSWVATTTNTNSVPSNSNSNWDILAKKGTDGSGSSIIVLEGGTNVPNTPHSEMNFSDADFDLMDQGSGRVLVSLSNKSKASYGCTGDQSLTASWQAINFDTVLLSDSDINIVNNSRVTVSRDMILKVSYNLRIRLDSGDFGRNTVISQIRKNGNSFLDFTMGASYSRGYNFNKNAVAVCSPTIISLNAGDYIELVYIRDDDYNSPHVGQSQTWIFLEEI